MTAAVRRRNFVAKMPGELLDRVRAANAQAETADGSVHAVEPHRETVGGNPTARDVRRVATPELQKQVAVAEDPDVVEQRHGPDLLRSGPFCHVVIRSATQ